MFPFLHAALPPWQKRSGKYPTPVRGSFSDYRVRVSARAQYVRLQISPQEGVVAVVPLRFDLARLPAILEAKRDWIEKHLARAGETETAAPAMLPETIELPALGEKWQVFYEPMNTAAVGITDEVPGVLTVYGAVENPSLCREALLGWLKKRTRQELCPLLFSLAAEHGFSFRESVVRCQKTRWGSCSATGVISVNCKLLFLPKNWVRCVLLHELCHTVYLNHSDTFYALMGRIDPACRKADRQMRQAGNIVPAWVEDRFPLPLRKRQAIEAVHDLL